MICGQAPGHSQPERHKQLGGCRYQCTLVFALTTAFLHQSWVSHKNLSALKANVKGKKIVNSTHLYFFDSATFKFYDFTKEVFVGK